MDSCANGLTHAAPAGPGCRDGAGWPPWLSKMLLRFLNEARFTLERHWGIWPGRSVTCTPLAADTGSWRTKMRQDLEPEAFFLEEPILKWRVNTVITGLRRERRWAVGGGRQENRHPGYERVKSVTEWDNGHCPQLGSYVGMGQSAGGVDIMTVTTVH